MMSVAVLIIMPVIIVSATIAPIIMAPAVIAVSAGTMPKIITVGSPATHLAAIAPLLVSTAAISPVALVRVGRDCRAQCQHGEGGQQKTFTHVNLPIRSKRWSPSDVADRGCANMAGRRDG